VIERLAIVGVGLLGGSVAKAARDERLTREIVGIARDAARLQPALREGVLDRATTDLVRGVRDADVILLAAPVLTNERVLEHVWDAVGAKALITDVGSVKSGIVRTAERLGAIRARQFVGSHPMAGSEQSGYQAARADLFHGATVIVTPTDATAPQSLTSVSEFWEAMGARVSLLDPESHDRVVAAVSHLPHLVAAALVDGVAALDSSALKMAARGFRDTTRIAAGDPHVWQEIFFANRPALLATLEGFRRALGDLEALITRDDPAALTSALARIKASREALR